MENFEFLLSHYADDSSLVSNDNPQSLGKLLFLLSLCSIYSGLIVNVDKTEAIWTGSKHGSREKYFLHNYITWNQTGIFKLLDIKFDLNAPNKTSRKTSKY